MSQTAAAHKFTKIIVDLPPERIKTTRTLRPYFGALIKAKYETQEAFAEAMGVPRSLLSEIINGWRDPSPERAKKWAKALGEDADILF